MRGRGRAVSSWRAKAALVRAAVLLLLAMSAVALACSSAVAFRGHSFSGAFGTFEEPSDVAVNEATGHVYVLDQGNARVQVFGHDEKFISQFDGSETPAKGFSFGTVALTAGITVDNSCYHKKLNGAACTAADPSNGNVYVTDPGHGVVDKFSAEGVYLGQLEEACGKASCPAFEFTSFATGTLSPSGIGVDASGTVWAYQEGLTFVPEGEVDSFSDGEPSIFHSATALGLVGGFVCPGFAVDSEDDLYARRAGNQPACTHSPTIHKFATSGKALIAPFVAEETSAVAVDLASDEVFLDNVSSVGAFSPSAVQQERFGAKGELLDGAGLAVNHENSTDSTVYVADAAANRVAVFGPEPPGPPTIVGQSLTDVTATSAKLQAEIDPHGASTEFHFEYGRCATPSTCASSPYEKSLPLPEDAAGSDFEVHSVSANPQDLAPGTVYHFRVLAHNELNEAGTFAEGEEQTFTTQPLGSFPLPDLRDWEMVSPPDKHGAAFEPLGAPGVTEASAAGDAITYLADAPPEAQPQGNAVESQVLSTRSSGGWRSHDIAPPHENASGQPIGNGQEYRFFSSDLSQGVVQRFGPFEPSLSAKASEQTPYLRNLTAPCLPAGRECYDPLVSGCPPEGECSPAVAEGANAAPGSVFGEEGKCPPNVVCGPRFRGATADLRHIVLASNAPLLETQVKGGLYEWSGGRLSLLSVLPEGEGGVAVAGNLGDLSGRNSANAISRDGARVVWMTGGSGGGGGPHLYVYDSAKEGSVRLDPELKEPPQFPIANADVSQVLFTQEGDLYRYDVAGEELQRLTEGAGVVGVLPGASEDGSYVYFVGNGKLAEGAVSGKCGDEFSTAGTCNLYLLHGGTISLVAVLSGEDAPDWQPFPDFRVARVSPGGRFLTFMSSQRLSGYDNRDALSGKPTEEVFLFDAGRPVGPGNPACASCDPSGARPVGVERGGLGPKSPVGGDMWQPQQFLAATMPGWITYALDKAIYQPRYLSDSGRLFFNSNEALSPQDVNGTWDVYQYELPGTGDCSTSSATFSERSGGCVGLISSGTSPEESGFLDASEDGSDVFFLTAAKLSPQDKDTALDVYDAHVCTAQSPCIQTSPSPPPPCSTEASCRAAPSPQPDIFGAPPSATFSGIGNVSSVAPPKRPRLTNAQKLKAALSACRKKHKKANKQARKKRAACERQARARYAKAKKRGKR